MLISWHLSIFFSIKVPVKPGVTLKDGLAKAMKLRELDPDICVVLQNKTRFVFPF